MKNSNVLGLLSLLLFLIFGCANPSVRRSQYEPKNYHDSDENGALIKHSTFFGNSKTQDKFASSFAEFRAVERCRELGFKFPIITYIADRTNQVTIQKSETSGNVIYGSLYMNTSAWAETYTSTFTVYYSCANEAYGLGVKVRKSPVII